MPDLLELDELLCRPSKRLVNDVKKIEGDIMILGLGGKMGPSLAKLALNAVKQADSKIKIMGASRFSNQSLRSEMKDAGIEIYAGDLLDDAFLESLPKAGNIIYMAGQKFGTSGQESLTWAMNAYLPGKVAEKFSGSNIVAFSTGNVYPFMPISGPGASEDTPLSPIGEYAQSCLGRERLFQYFCEKDQTPTVIYRLNYALDLRYGVLNDIAMAVKDGKEIDLQMGYANVIWQGDANEYAIRSLLHCKVPANPINITGPEIISVQALAETFGVEMGIRPVFRNVPEQTALLSDARKSYELFGDPQVSLDDMIKMTVKWIEQGGDQLQKPTHFQERKGNF